jgi:5-methylcytosine-specific restriction enzyme B
MIPKNDPIKSLIENYKKRITETELKDEVYKWELVNEYRGRPNPETPDFYQEIKDVKFKNLIYAMGIAVINHLARDKPEELRQLFINLFDETKDLTERVKSFNKDSLKIYRELGETLQHHQDERSIATYLTFYDSEKYTFYKSSFYKKYCKLIGVKEARKNEKYTHYLKLIDELIENHIAPDKELIEQVKKLIPDYYNGTNHKLLAQDILFQMLDKEQETNYWIFQGNPKVFDFETSLRDEILTDWTVSAHKDKIKTGDKVILWITGGKSGCYALAEVISEPHEKTSSPDDHLWKGEDKSTLKADIKITHNFVDSPILKSKVDSLEVLRDLKVGNQGTNFSATEEEYQAILDLSQNNNKKQFWLYAPGENAYLWDEFYREGIMALGWDEIGDLSQFQSRIEIKNALVNAYGGTGSKKNDVPANDDFLNKVKIGDTIIAKKGRGELLGYGIVTSDYIFDKNRENYQKTRKVDWKLKGNWKVDFSLVLKTLTDITKYRSDHPDYDKYYERLLGIMGQNNKIEKKEDMNFPLNTILYGPPGTGKTYNTVLRAAEIIENRKIDSYDEALGIFKANLHDQIEFITFHQNYSYEDFIQGLRPDTENDKQLTFERKDGVFKVMSDRALKNITASEQPPVAKKTFEETFNEFVYPLVEGEVEEIEVRMKKVSYFITAITNKSIEFRKTSGGTEHTLSISTLRKMYDAESVLDIQGLSSYYSPLLDGLLKIGKDASGKKEIVQRKNYVIIIDEINRANISRVFGELITLIEPDKRSHGTIPLEARLPSGDPFIVPSNLFIIGTMNTADKSIALLDIALRRRFEFESMYPKYEIEGQEIYDVEILQKINELIIQSKGHDFQIGHAYFMGENKDLVQRMNKKVIPLLLEYYMNDEKEVKGILQSSGLIIEEKSWPLRIIVTND